MIVLSKLLREGELGVGLEKLSRRGGKSQNLRKTHLEIFDLSTRIWELVITIIAGLSSLTCN
jgi:hypothetical protein